MEGDVTSRFWSKVDVRDKNECWPWTAKARHRFGYGTFRISKEAGVIGAHRFAYEIAKGAIPHGKLVRHSCDNPACCNPQHLDIGTDAENMADKMRRGRLRYGRLRGEENGRAKLSVADVRAIRESRLASRKAAKVWGVSAAQILRIRRGEAWKVAA